MTFPTEPPVEYEPAPCEHCSESPCDCFCPDCDRAHEDCTCEQPPGGDDDLVERIEADELSKGDEGFPVELTGDSVLVRVGRRFGKSERIRQAIEKHGGTLITKDTLPPPPPEAFAVDPVVYRRELLGAFDDDTPELGINQAAIDDLRESLEGCEPTCGVCREGVPVAGSNTCRRCAETSGPSNEDIPF